MERRLNVIGGAPMDLSQQIESEQRRLQERSQIAYLQSQLDDLRHRLEQHAARSQLAGEQARQVQDLFSQQESKFEAQMNELKLQEQTRQRAFQNLQKEIAEVRIRLEEPARQLLNVMSQVQDLQEGLRVLRDQVNQRLEIDKQVDQRLEELRAQGMLREERLARLDTILGQLQQGEENRMQLVRQSRDEIELERQNLRRQAAETERMAADLRAERQELIARLNRQIESQRQAGNSMKDLEEKIESLQPQFDRLASELQRVERDFVDRTLQSQERLEDLRQSVQREWGELRTAEERRVDSQNAWLRRIEELYHGLDERIVRKDDEATQALTRVETRLDAMEKSGDGVMRALLDLFQGQLERGAEDRLSQAKPAAEKKRR